MNMNEVTWRDCMELSSIISSAILESQDEELMKITLGQLNKIKEITKNEIKSYFENNENERLQTRN